MRNIFFMALLVCLVACQSNETIQPLEQSLDVEQITVRSEEPNTKGTIDYDWKQSTRGDELDKVVRLLKNLNEDYTKEQIQDYYNQIGRDGVKEWIGDKIESHYKKYMQAQGILPRSGLIGNYTVKIPNSTFTSTTDVDFFISNLTGSGNNCPGSSIRIAFTTPADKAAFTTAYMGATNEVKDMLTAVYGSSIFNPTGANCLNFSNIFTADLSEAATYQCPTPYKRIEYIIN